MKLISRCLVVLSAIACSCFLVSFCIEALSIQFNFIHCGMLLVLFMLFLSITMALLSEVENETK